MCVMVRPHLDDAEPVFDLALRADALFSVLTQTLHKALGVCDGPGDARQLGLGVLVHVVQ